MLGFICTTKAYLYTLIEEICFEIWIFGIFSQKAVHLGGTPLSCAYWFLCYLTPYTPSHASLIHSVGCLAVCLIEPIFIYTYTYSRSVMKTRVKENGVFHYNKILTVIIAYYCCCCGQWYCVWTVQVFMDKLSVRIGEDVLSHFQVRTILYQSLLGADS